MGMTNSPGTNAGGGTKGNSAAGTKEEGSTGQSNKNMHMKRVSV